jgi:hypothetical protein
MCGGTRVPDQPHHDHVIDFARDELRSLLNDEWSRWVSSKGAAFYRNLTQAREPCGELVVRFPATWMCNECNPVDGNGKPLRLRKFPLMVSFNIIQ